MVEQKMIYLCSICSQDYDTLYEATICESKGSHTIIEPGTLYKREDKAQLYILREVNEKIEPKIHYPQYIASLIFNKSTTDDLAFEKFDYHAIKPQEVPLLEELTHREFYQATELIKRKVPSVLRSYKKLIRGTNRNLLLSGDPRKRSNVIEFPKERRDYPDFR